MTPTQTLDVAVGEYVGRCMEHLRDLPEATRDEILDDIRQMVAEVSAELDGNPSDLLGPPDLFVEELRTAAGVGTATLEPVRRSGGAGPIGRHVLTFMLDRIRAVDIADWVRTLFRELRPAGWVVRGYAFGALFAYSMSNGTADAHWLFGILPVPKLSGSAITGGLVTAAMIAASVELGRRKPQGWWKVALVGASLASVLVLGATTNDLRSQTAIRGDGDLVFADSPAHLAVAEITEGTMVDEAMAAVFLFDQSSGVGFEAHSVPDAVAVFADLLETAGGKPITVSYRGNEAQAASVEALRELLFAWGMPAQ